MYKRGILAFRDRVMERNGNAPKKYWDLYDPKEIPLDIDTKSPAGGAAMGLHASFELRVRAGIPNPDRSTINFQ